MTAKTTTERQQTLKAKRKAEGLVRLELWVKPEHKEDIKQYAARMSAKTGKKAPYKCFAGFDLHEGDRIIHPDGDIGIIVYDDSQEHGDSKWRVEYASGPTLWLGNQVGDRGQAILYKVRADFKQKAKELNQGEKK